MIFCNVCIKEEEEEEEYQELITFCQNFLVRIDTLNKK